MLGSVVVASVEAWLGNAESSSAERTWSPAVAENAAPATKSAANVSAAATRRVPDRRFGIFGSPETGRWLINHQTEGYARGAALTMNRCDWSHNLGGAATPRPTTEEILRDRNFNPPSFQARFHSFQVCPHCFSGCKSGDSVRPRRK